MHLRIAVDFGSRGLENTGADTLGKPEHVDGANDAGLHGLDWIVLVMNRRGRTGQVIDLIDFKQDRLDHVMTKQFKTAIVQQVRHILSPPGEKVVKAND